MVSRIYKQKACCGTYVTILETDKPIRKSQIDAFISVGYLIPENFTKQGVFYAQLGGLIVYGSFGSNRFSIRCSGKNCDDNIASFQTLLEKTINS